MSNAKHETLAEEVLETLKDRSFSKEDTIEWIYSKAKGGAEWMV